MIFNARIILGHLIFSVGIQVDLAKVEVIVHFPVEKSQKEVRIFLGHVSYYRRFIEYFFWDICSFISVSF